MVSTSTTRWSTGCWNRIPPRIQAADRDAATRAGRGPGGCGRGGRRGAAAAPADRDAGLTPLDVELLLVSLLPDLDTRFERLYGYLNDDVTRRRASVALALELAGASPMVAAARARLEPSRPLLRHGLLVVDDPDRPLLTRAASARPGVGPPAG